MTFYVVRRIAVGIFLLFIMSAMFFTLTRVTPGAPIQVGENPRVHQDQVNRRLHRLGLTDPDGNSYPIPQQYALYLGALLHGDLGDSYQYNTSVTKLLLQRLPNTALLLGSALVIALVIGIPLGIYAATHQYSKLDMTTSITSYIGVSIPSFVLGIYLLLIFAVFLKQSPLHWGFPLFGMHTGGAEDPLDLLYHMVLPVISLTILEIAIFSRFMRASMLEVLHQDYIRTAGPRGWPWTGSITSMLCAMPSFRSSPWLRSRSRRSSTAPLLPRGFSAGLEPASSPSRPSSPVTTQSSLAS